MRFEPMSKLTGVAPQPAPAPAPAAEPQLVLTDREQAIVDVLRSTKLPLTDREIAREVGTRDMNAVRPNITRLMQRGVLRQVDRAFDRKTGRTVRRVLVAWRSHG